MTLICAKFDADLNISKATAEKQSGPGFFGLPGICEEWEWDGCEE